MKHLFIFVLLSISFIACGQRENQLPIKTLSSPTDTIRVVIDNQSSIMQRQVLQGAIYDSLVAHRSDIDGLLYPYQYPAFTSFLISGQSTTLECGVDLAGGYRTFTWGTSNSTNVVAFSIDLDDVTTSTNLITGTANDGIDIIDIGSAITKTATNTQHRWRITGDNTNSGDFTRDFYVTWYSPFYYGVGAQALAVSQIQALTKDVSAQATKVYTFNPSSQVMYMAYPASYGTLSSIEDPNGFETIADWTLRVENFTNNPPNYEGTTVSYNIYEYDNVTTQTDFDITFIY